MAEDKKLKEKKTKEINENIYALDFDFDDDGKKENTTIEADNGITFEKDDDIDFTPRILKEIEENENEEQLKKKKVLSKIEEGIKSSKKGRPRKTTLENVAKATAKTQRKRGRKPKSNTDKQSAIKMHTENNRNKIRTKCL